MMVNRDEIKYWQCKMCSYTMTDNQMSFLKLQPHPFLKCPRCGYDKGLNVVLNKQAKEGGE